MDVSSAAAVEVLLTDNHDVCFDVTAISSTHASDNFTSTNERGHNSIGHIGIEKGFRVLDLCCAPGLKTCAIADLIEKQNFVSNISKRAIVIGTDVSKHRMSLCRNILKKYRVQPLISAKRTTTPIDKTKVTIRLYIADGTTFGTKSSGKELTLLFDSNLTREKNLLQTGKFRKKRNKSKRLNMLSKSFKRISGYTKNSSGDDLDTNSQLSKSTLTKGQFDRVLVDAECNTDGAVGHVHHKVRNPYLKRKKQHKSNRYDQKTRHEDKSSHIVDHEKLICLQKKLIASGFRMLKPGGEMVYSTCSLDQEQNEDVVMWLLRNDKYRDDAFLVPLMLFSNNNNNNNNIYGSDIMVREGFLSGTIRFQPNLRKVSINSNDKQSMSACNLTFGGGLFMAKIAKRDV